MLLEKISDRNSLEAASARLHDARFRSDDIHFDAKSKEFGISCWQLVAPDEPATSKKRKWRKWNLAFSGVEKYIADTKEPVPHYELSSIRYQPSKGEIELVTHYALTIRLKTPKLQGVLSETEIASNEPVPW